LGWHFFLGAAAAVSTSSLRGLASASRTLLGWVNRDEVDSVEREGEALCHANEIVKLAGAFFARAEFDRRPKAFVDQHRAPFGSSRSATYCGFHVRFDVGGQALLPEAV
jgi:transposase